MRIFERLRVCGRGDNNLKRKLFEAVTAGFLESIEEETTAPVLAATNGNCCSCCAAEDRTVDRH
jgi:hypothetical protein